MSIKNNTAKLETLLGKINDLPLNGSGGSTTTLGTWLLNDELTPGKFTASFAFQVGDIEYMEMSADNSAGLSLYYDGEMVYNNGWLSNSFKKISVLEEITNGTCATWLINNGDHLSYANGYEDGLLTVEEEVNIQMNLVENIQNLLGELPDAGSGGSSDPILWGSYALKTHLLAEHFIQNTYDLQGLGIYTYFWDGEDWLYESIASIETSPDDGFMLVFGGQEIKAYYFEDGWYDSNDEQHNHNRLLVIEVPSPVQVSQDIYSLFESMVDVDADNDQPFDLGYALGAAEGGGSSEDLEALGVLCDWQFMTDGSSFPVVTIINYHPSYYLHCNIIFDGEVVPFVVGPAPDADGTASSYSWADYGLPFSEARYIDVVDVRWKANA